MENMKRTFYDKESDTKIPKEELIFEDLRSSGPGGQNVNKVATGRRVRWNFENSRYLTKDQKEIIKRKVFKQYLTRGGEIIVKSVEERAQGMNTKRALERLGRIVYEALAVPKERRATKPTKTSKARSKKEKKIRSGKKKLRKDTWEV